MKVKQKGIISLVATVAVIVLTAFVAVFGIGSKKWGSMSDVKLGLDLAGGVSITYEAVKENPTRQEMDDTFYKMQLRAQDFNSEAAVYMEGDTRINVDIPDVTDANVVLEKLGDAGKIYFIYGQSSQGEENITFDAENGGYKLARPLEDIIADGDVVIDGACIAGAEAVIGQGSLGANDYQVKLTLNDSGKSRFSEATAYAYSYYNPAVASIRNIIAIVYDGAVYSAPMVSAHITDGNAVINGQKDYDESKQLASIIRNGALPLELREIRSTVVGAKLGTEAINTSLLAGVIGFVLVLAFMIVVYRIPLFEEYQIQKWKSIPQYTVRQDPDPLISFPDYVTGLCIDSIGIAGIIHMFIKAHYKFFIMSCYSFYFHIFSPPERAILCL